MGAKICEKVGWALRGVFHDFYFQYPNMYFHGCVWTHADLLTALLWPSVPCSCMDLAKVPLYVAIQQGTLYHTHWHAHVKI